MKDKYNRELPLPLQWPPPPSQLSMFDKILFSMGLMALVGFVATAGGCWYKILTDPSFLPR